jgi:hypothetical protein
MKGVELDFIENSLPYLVDSSFLLESKAKGKVSLVPS